MTDGENILWRLLRAHRLNGEIMSNPDGVLATVMAAVNELPLSLPSPARGEGTCVHTVARKRRGVKSLRPIMSIAP